MRTVGDLLGLLRIGNSLVIGFAAVTGYVVGGGSNYYYAVLLSLSAMMIGCYGNVINDICDIEIDRVNKPWRPLPSERISIKTAWLLAVLLAGIGASLSFLINVSCLIIAVSAVFLLYAYSRWVKRTGFIGNVLIAFLSFLVVVYGGMAAPVSWRSLVPGLYAFLIIVGREILKGLEDIEGDRLHGVSTIAVKYGVRKALVLGMVFLSAVVLISPLPYLYMDMNIFYLTVAVLGVDIPILTSLKIILVDPVKHAWRATRILKIPLFMGLVAFFLGAMPW